MVLVPPVSLELVWDIDPQPPRLIFTEQWHRGEGHLLEEAPPLCVDAPLQCQFPINPPPPPPPPPFSDPPTGSDSRRPFPFPATKDSLP